MNIPSITSSSVLSHAEPVLAVKDIAETVNYWHEVIGFPEKWIYGDPPNHGGVSWRGTAFIQFGLDPKLAAVSKGYSVWIRARDIKSLYEFHQQQNVKIVSPLENKAWGHSEYTLEDINGYYIHFSSSQLQGIHREEILPESIHLLKRAPRLDELKKLTTSVGWSSDNLDKSVRKQLKSVVFAVVAEDKLSKEIVGCALLMGDKVSFYYVKDVIVHPAWQRKGVGTAMMKEISQWAEKKAPDNATIGLFTGDHLASFYKQFGFMQACGMYRQITRK
jgi:GNAT superfamily N-acetyltransferase